jgi:hypothetical protein
MNTTRLRESTARHRRRETPDWTPRETFVSRALDVLLAEEEHAAENGWYELAGIFRDARRALEGERRAA